MKSAQSLALTIVSFFTTAASVLPSAALARETEMKVMSSLPFANVGQASQVSTNMALEREIN